jgi:hypothetical protein
LWGLEWVGANNPSSWNLSLLIPVTQDLGAGPVRGGKKGPLTRASSSKDVYISKDLGDEIILLKRTYSVKFKLDCKPK